MTSRAPLKTDPVQNSGALTASDAVLYLSAFLRCDKAAPGRGTKLTPGEAALFPAAAFPLKDSGRFRKENEADFAELPHD